MRSRVSVICRCTAILTSLFAPAPAVHSADWPCYQADPCRSGVTGETLAFPVAVAWQYQPSQPPRPAWPDPGRTQHLMDFDYASHPVVAGGRVFFGSSADDTVRALDAQTGIQQWCFTARGPIRFAPHVAGGRCYIAGDDGYVYCLDASRGGLLWEFRAAPDDRMAIGNERMISRSPCRSGVLVTDGVAYVTAGMWPSEGVVVYALDAASGKVLWRNDTSGSLYLPHPHASASFGGPAPQGYLLASGDVLVVPTGRAAPAGFDRRTGRLLYCHTTAGSAWATIARDVVFTRKIKMENQDHDVVSLSDCGPAEGDGLEAHSLSTGQPQWDLAEGYRGLASKSKARSDKAADIRDGLVNRQFVLWSKQTLYAVGGGAIEAIDGSDAKRLRRLWRAEHARAYSAVLSGDALLVGGAGTITAFRTSDGTQAWRASTNGQVRGLAVANGQLIAATEKGTILCFRPGKDRAAPAEQPPAGPEPTATAARASAALAAEVCAELVQAERLRGYALVIGENDACLAEALARRTQLHVLCVLSNQAQVSAERGRLLRQTDLYGGRVVVHQVNSDGVLPYAPYFANVVLVSGKAAGVSGKELYRILRPCGGRMVFVGESRANAAACIEEARVPAAEVLRRGDSFVIVRGKLSGAFDWNSEVDCDQRVQWPLELLWFGGPGPARMLARHWKAPTPVFANGRYFAIGQYHVVAVDAYNGCELWSRQIGGNTGYKILKLAADDHSVYVHFPGYAAEFDAQTGTLRKLYGQPKPSSRLTLEEPRSVSIVHGVSRLGSVGISKTASGLELTLSLDVTDSPPSDSWQLHFDFRSTERQFADAGPGAFRFSVNASDGSWQAGLGGPIPRLNVSKQPPAAGSKLVISIPWDGVRDLLGQPPAHFRFAATLQHEEPRRPQVRAHAYADGLATFANDGWATFVLNPARAAADAALPVPVCKLEDLPPYAREWPRQPRQFTAEWTLDGYDKLELLHWPPLGRDSIPAQRTQPLTGQPGERTYTKSHGCGGTISSATVDFFRSGTFGIYDRADDSGLRNFAAIRPGCGMTMVPAGGVLLSSEGQADCTCSFNFQTSFALAPAAVRRNEDWALFDSNIGTSLIRGAALNLGSPGDRRDEQGLLWLGYPRPPLAVGRGLPGKAKPYTFDVPCELEFHEGFGPYRFNADRVPIRGTDRPWVYASGCRGLKTLTLNLLHGQEQAHMAVATARPPKIDAVLDDPCWNGIAPLELPDQKTTVHLRHDAEALYVSAKGEDESSPREDTRALQMTLREDGEPRFARLDVAGDGSQRSARWECLRDVPRMEAISVDGKAGDWGDAGAVLVLPGGAACRLGWNDEGLLMLADLPREFSAQAPELTGMLAMFIEPASMSFLQLAADAKSQTCSLDHRVRNTASRPTPPVARNVSGLMHWGHPFGETVAPGPTFRSAESKAEKGILIEAVFPWTALGGKAAAGKEVPFQVVFFDPDKVDPKFGKGGDWRPQVLAEVGTLGRLRLSPNRGAPIEGTSLVNQRYGRALACLVQQARGWAPKWTCAAKRQGQSLLVEAAIPWTSLGEAGIHRERLKISFAGPGKLDGTARQVSEQFERSARPVAWERAAAASRPYTVRLHFCEPEDVRQGERVFDVKLQGKTVLENLDVSVAAGGRNMALVNEFRRIMAEKSIRLEFVPKSPRVTERTAPILSGIEVFEE